jgi:uncharacterized protein (DUF433 family)
VPSVFCGVCQTRLDEPPGLDPADRRPCPVCGSKSRQFNIHLSSQIEASGSLDIAISRPLYSLPDAARFARTNSRRLRRWAEGYSVGGKDYEGLLQIPQQVAPSQTLLSFENLVEAALIAGWRRRGIPLQRIRKAHALAIQQFGPHPLAHRNIYYAGRDLFVEADREGEGGTHFVTLTRAGQVALTSAVAVYLQTFDWAADVDKPYQWRPLEGADVVKLNPAIEFGLPNIRRVRTETLLRRFLARESVSVIARDFRLKPREVEHALRYEWALNEAA